MGIRKLEIAETVFRLCAYTTREAGVAVLAHTDAGTVDLFIEGNRHENPYESFLIHEIPDTFRVSFLSARRFIR